MQNNVTLFFDNLKNSDFLEHIKQHNAYDLLNPKVSDFLTENILNITNNHKNNKYLESIVDIYDIKKTQELIFLQKTFIQKLIFKFFDNINALSKITERVDNYFNNLIIEINSIQNDKNILLSEIINNLSDPLCILDRNFNFTYINFESSRLWGDSVENILGKNICNYFPDFYESEYGNIMRESFKNKVIKDTQMYYKKYKKWFSVTLYPSEKYLTIFSRDVTEQKITKEALSKMEDDLQQFSYIASHDLQEPLRMIKSFLQLIEKKYSDKIDKKGMEYIKYAVEGSERMQSLIMDLLTYSRVETKKSNLVYKSINEIIKFTEKELKDKISITNTTINIDDNIPELYVDFPQISLAFKHIIDNAINYSKDGIDPIIEIKYEKLENKYSVIISDNGIGIEHQHFEKIFLPFKRLHSRIEKPGNGIGLAICKKIMDRHQGKITIDSVINEGTKIYLSFPEN